jgi:uncharacterized protein YunC (DUF1805 family)
MSSKLLRIPASIPTSVIQEAVSAHLSENGKPGNTIYFRNWTQKCLWDNEISGQISDGHWENSANSNYSFWSRLDTAVDAASPRVDGKTYGNVKFNLTNSDLLDVVQDRMICVAKMSKVSKDEKIVGAADYLEGITSLEGFQKELTSGHDYKKEKLAIFSPELITQWLAVTYTEQNLKSDLRDMSDIMKTAGSSWSGGTKGANRIKIGFEEKDTQRIKDIITKSKGSTEKELALSLTMAKKIGDGRKALQRAAAASALEREDIADIFTTRAKELGIVEGVSEDTFPDEPKPLSKEELLDAKIKKLEPVLNQFADDQVGSDRGRCGAYVRYGELQISFNLIKDGKTDRSDNSPASKGEMEDSAAELIELLAKDPFNLNLEISTINGYQFTLEEVKK